LFVVKWSHLPDIHYFLRKHCLYLIVTLPSFIYLFTAGVEVTFTFTWSHSDAHHSRQGSSGQVIGPAQRPVYLTTHNTHKRQTPMPPVGFELTIPASARPQTHASDRAATGIGQLSDDGHKCGRNMLQWAYRVYSVLIGCVCLNTAIAHLTSSIRSSKLDVLRENANPEAVYHYFKRQKL
jgi:hypothetical protein